MILNSPGVLTWYESLAEQAHRQTYAYGKVTPLLCERNQMPPFQLVVPLGTAAISSFKLVNLRTGAETDILAGIQLVGFQKNAFPTYEVIRYPSNGLIAGALFEVGQYYGVMSNGVDTYYSEVFSMCYTLEGLQRLEFCHTENLELPVGVIDYSNGFVNFLYFDTEIGKPAYQYERQVSQRNGYNFPKQQIRYKLHRFEVFLNEPILDALSLAPLHDVVRVVTPYKTLEVDEIRVIPEWQEQGDIAAVEVEFKTDTVIVVNGRAVSSASCGVGSGECISVDYNAVAVIVQGSAEFTGNYYTTPEGSTVNFENGDLVLVENLLGNTLLFEWQSGSYLPVSMTTGEYVFEANTGGYWYENGGSTLITNELTGATYNVAEGTALSPGSVQIVGLLASGEEVLVGVSSAADFTASGAEFEILHGLKAIKIVVGNALCANYFTSDWYYFGPFDLIEVMGDYPGDKAAGLGGVQPGQYYALTLGNNYGLPQGIIKQMEPYTGYGTDAAAVAALGNDCPYPMLKVNALGVPGGTIRITPDVTPTYASDALAAAGGVAVGELYAFDATAWGFLPYFVKKRNS